MIKKGKRQAINWEIFAIHMSDKGLVFRMYKELQLKKKNADNQFFLNGQKILTCTSKKEDIKMTKKPMNKCLI